MHGYAFDSISDDREGGSPARSVQRCGMPAFVDRARIFIRSGKGGDGHVSFYREKFVANGGPDGGDGGRGGDVIFVVDKGLNSLSDFHYGGKYKAENGCDGEKRRRTGKSGADLIITDTIDKAFSCIGR